jgi:hypothetical protein
MIAKLHSTALIVFAGLVSDTQESTTAARCQFLKAFQGVRLILPPTRSSRREFDRSSILSLVFIWYSDRLLASC